MLAAALSCLLLAAAPLSAALGLAGNLSAPYLAPGKCSALVVNNVQPPVAAGLSPDSVPNMALNFPGAVGYWGSDTVLFTSALASTGSLMSVGAGGMLNFLSSGRSSSTSTFPASAFDAQLTPPDGGYLGGGLRPTRSGRSVYISANLCIFRLDDTGVLTRVAGVCDKSGYAGDGGDALLSLNSGWLGLALAEDRNELYFTDIWNSVVRKVDMTTGIITTIAGANNKSFPVGERAATPGDGSLASDAVFAYPWHCDYYRNALYVLDSGLHNVRRIDLATNRVTFVVGYSNTIPYASLPPPDFGSTGVAATSIRVQARGLSFRPNGAMLIAGDNSHTIRELSPGGIITTLVGTPGICGYSGDGGPASAAQVCNPWGVSVLPDGSVLIADSGNNAIRRVDGKTGIISTIAGGEKKSAAQTFTAAVNSSCAAMALLSTGDLVVSGCGPNKLNLCRLVPSIGSLDVIAGPPATVAAKGYSGDGGPALGATFNMNDWAPPYVDPRNDDIYIPDHFNNVVRKISAGLVTRVAGVPGKQGYVASQEGGPATSAWLYGPSAVLLVPATWDLLVIDAFNNCIRKVIAQTGNIVTVAGRCGTNQNPEAVCNFSPDGTPALTAILKLRYDSAYFAASLDLTPDGSLIFIDQMTMVRYIDPGGRLRTLAGVSCSDKAAGLVPLRIANNTPALSTELEDTMHALLYPGGDVLFTNRFGVWAIRAGVLLLVAGTPGSVKCSVDGSTMNNPKNMVVGRHGELFVYESGCIGVRMFPLGARTVCPTGYACSCGYNPAPCASPAAFCPANSSKPLPANPGFVTLFAPGLDGASNAVTQAPCPLGAFCQGGVAKPCLGGSFGVRGMQANPSDCIACPSGSFVAQSGTFAAASGAPPCSPCPPGTTSAGAASRQLCLHCPPGTFAPAGASAPCAPCANGTSAYNGAPACFPSLSTDGAQSVGGVYLFQRFPLVTTGDLDPAALLALTISACVPLAAFAVAVLLTVVVLYNLCRGVACTRIMLTLLAQLDQFKVEIRDDGTLHSESTAVGGLATILGLGATVALMTASVVAYARSNTLLQQAVMPVSISGLQGFSDLPRARLEAGGLPRERTLASGFSLTISAMGRFCDVAGNASASLLTSALVYTPPAPAGNASATPHFEHTWACADCMVNDQSRFSATFHRSCQSFLVSVSTATVSGGYTLSSFNFSNPAPPQLLTSVTATVPLFLEVVQDQALGKDRGDGVFLGGRTASGFQALAAVGVAGQQGDADDRGGRVAVAIELPLQPTFVLYTMTPLLTLGGLFASLAAWAGVFGSFIILKTGYKDALEFPEAARKHWLFRALFCLKRPQGIVKSAGGEGAAVDAPANGAVAPLEREGGGAEAGAAPSSSTTNPLALASQRGAWVGPQPADSNAGAAAEEGGAGSPSVAVAAAAAAQPRQPGDLPPCA